MSIKEHPPQHVPVLLDASIKLLDPQPGEKYLDLTAGYGGHAEAFLNITGNTSGACLVDRDINALASLKRFSDQGVKLLHRDFVAAAQQLIDSQETFDCILVDLGVSSPQLDRAERGFSFSMNGPLDMRMDDRQLETAADMIDRLTLDELTNIIYRYGEETRSVAKRYAQAIIDHRPMTTTTELADTILQAHVGPRQRIHPATRTFQAIRIALNRELEQVEQMLQLLPKLLKKDGRVGVISFHSLEDRIVKRYFLDQARSGYESELRLVTKKAIKGTEDVNNPRARSAKLRVAAKN